MVLIVPNIFTKKGPVPIHKVSVHGLAVNKPNTVSFHTNTSGPSVNWTFNNRSTRSSHLFHLSPVRDNETSFL